MVEVKCETCGERLERSLPLVKKNRRHFCNRSCLAQWHKLHFSGANSPRWSSIEVKCSHCAAPLHRSPARATSNKHHFCNQACKSEWQRHSQRGSNNPRWLGGERNVPCDNCGASLKRRPYDLRADKGYFCDRDCRIQWEYKQQVEVTCSGCGSALRRVKCRARAHEHHFCNKRCRGDWLRSSGALNGENNPAWKGGAIEYYGPNWNAQARAARKRDGYKCQHCGINQKRNGRALDVHHIHPFREFGYVPGENERYVQANDLQNLISLCPSCHHKAERGSIPVQRKLAI